MEFVEISSKSLYKEPNNVFLGAHNKLIYGRIELKRPIRRVQKPRSICSSNIHSSWKLNNFMENDDKFLSRRGISFGTETT